MVPSVSAPETVRVTETGATPETLSLRDRKKERTRRALRDTAERLFHEQGYEATTLEQICVEVEVHVRTLLRYFETKEHVVLARQYEALERFRAGILSPERDVDALTFWRRFVTEQAAQSARNPALLDHLRLIMSVPAVIARWLAISVEYEDLLATALTEETDGGPEAVFRARMLAALLVGSSSTVIRDWVAGGGKGDLEALCRKTVDYATECFRPLP